MRVIATAYHWTNRTPVIYDKLSCIYTIRRVFLTYLVAPTTLLLLRIAILTWRFNFLAHGLYEILIIYIYWRLGVALFAEAPSHETNPNPFFPITLAIQGIFKSVSLSPDDSRGMLQRSRHVYRQLSLRRSSQRTRTSTPTTSNDEVKVIDLH